MHGILSRVHGSLTHFNWKSLFQQRLLGWSRPNNHRLIASALSDATRSRSELITENALLRQQLIILQRQVKRPKLTHHDRRLIVLLARYLPNWKHALLIVQPDTLLRWHRELFRIFWRRKSHVQSAQPRVPQEVVELILNQRHLHRVVSEYIEYFNAARPHQALEQGIPCGGNRQASYGMVRASPILNGLHHDYRRVA